MASEDDGTEFSPLASKLNEWQKQQLSISKTQSFSRYEYRACGGAKTMIDEPKQLYHRQYYRR